MHLWAAPALVGANSAWRARGASARQASARPTGLAKGKFEMPHEGLLHTLLRPDDPDTTHSGSPFRKAA
jgi:hypothetical protein